MRNELLPLGHTFDPGTGGWCMVVVGFRDVALLELPMIHGTTWGRVPVLCRKRAADHNRWETDDANDVH